ncbi:MAG: acetyltransferase [Candidatus Saccharibacteria bacterium]|nr:acetyltransferase [Candidatus Saccharibacteria bacterium]
MKEAFGVPVHINVIEHADILFALDSRVTASSPYMFPTESPSDLVEFLSGKNQGNTYVWKNEEGRLISSLTLVDRPEHDAIEILSIGVDPDLQSQGYGGEMISFAEQLASLSGHRKLYLLTSPKNKRAIGFYLNNGFRITGSETDYFGNKELRHIMTKDLAKNPKTRA